VFNAGLLKAGDVLVSNSPTFHGSAEVTEDGQIRLANGDVFSSPSLSFIALVKKQGGSGARNGWHCWRVGNEDGPILDELRAKVQPSVGAADEGELSGSHAFRVDFWQGLYEWCGEDQAFVDAFGDPSDRADNKDSWSDFGIGLGDCHVSNRVSSHYSRVGTGVWFRVPEKYADLLAYRDELEGELAGDGVTFKWADTDSNTRHPNVFAFKHHDFLDSKDGDDLDEVYAWMAHAMLRMRAFALKACS
jgi:hypothetical protein